MTDEEPQTKKQQDPTITALREEFSKQMEEFKLTVQKDMDAKDKKIAELEKTNASLNSELVRVSLANPKVEEKPKTKEELYQEELDKSVATCKNYIKQII